MSRYHTLLTVILLSIFVVSTSHAHTETDQIDLYKTTNFALGIGAAIVKFDTKLKFTDKTRSTFDSIFIDPEGNLDLPETSSVTTFYGAWNINPDTVSASRISVLTVNPACSILMRHLKM